MAIDLNRLPNIGANPNDGSGDPIRVGGQKINNIFTEIYDAITPAGANVGIGITTPAVILDVVSANSTAGQIRARYNALGEGFTINQLSSGGTVTLNQKANADLILSSNNTSQVWIKNNGKIGAGTSTPVSNFHVHSTANSSIRITDASSGATLTDGLALIKYVGYADVWLFDNEEMRFGTNNAEQMRIGANGNIGIANSSSINKLSVGGDIWLSGNSIVGKNVNYSGNVTSNVSSYIYSYAAGSLGQYRAGMFLDGTNQEVILYTSNIERIHINSSGDFEMGSQANVVNNLRTFDITNKDPSSGAGAAVRLVSTDAAATGDTVSADLIKYKTGEFTVYNREVNATAGFTSFVFNPSGVKNEVLRITANNRIVVNGAIVASGSPGTTGQVLTSNGTGNIYWTTPTVFTVNVNAQYIWTNTHTFSNSVTFNKTINTNDGAGIAGQVLTSNGSGNVYWAAAVNTSGQYVWSNTQTFSVINASSSTGTAGQVLTSNGSSNVYWSTAVNTAAQYVWTNTHTFTNSITFTSNAAFDSGIIANGSIGAAGQMLTSDGAEVYWSSPVTNGKIYFFNS